jgi:hypothetical protein
MDAGDGNPADVQRRGVALVPVRCAGCAQAAAAEWGSETVIVAAVGMVPSSYSMHPQLMPSLVTSERVPKLYEGAQRDRAASKFLALLRYALDRFGSTFS